MARTVPPEVASTWPEPNYKNPQTFGNALLIVNVIFLVLTTPVVGIRMYTRWHMRRWLGWDDFWCCLALVFSIGFSIVAILAAYVYGSDRHFWDIQISNLSQIYQLAMTSKVLFTCAGMAVRQSLLCFYLRLIGEAGMKNFRWLVHSVTFANIFVSIAFVFLCIFQCKPVSAYWKYPSELYGSCLDEGTITLSCGIVITALDLVVVLLPIPIILRLQMSWRQKFGVAVLLNMGLIASAAAAVRSYYIWKALVQSYDETWYVYPLWTAATVELDVAIMAACAPASRPFVVKYLPWMITPVHKLGDLVSFVQRKKDRIHTEQSTTAVSEKDKDYVRSTAPMFGDDLGPSRSMEKQPFHQSADVEQGDSRDDAVKSLPNGFTAAKDADRISIDQEEVLHAVSQAIRGMGTLPEDIFAAHGRPSRESKRQPSYDVAQSGLMADKALARGSSSAFQAPQEQRRVVQKHNRSRSSSASSHSTIPLGSYTRQSFDFERTGRPPSRLINRTSGRISTSPGRTSRPSNGSELANDLSSGHASSRPRQDQADSTKRDMPNAFWNRERTKDRKKEKHRSRSLDVLHSRQAMPESSEDEEQPRDGLGASLSREASQRNRKQQDLDPLTARLVRQYSIPGVKQAFVDIPPSHRARQTPPEERSWEHVDSGKAPYQPPRRSSADMLQQSSQQQTQSSVQRRSQLQAASQSSRAPLFPNNSSASWSMRNDPSRQPQNPPPPYSMNSSPMTRVPQHQPHPQPAVDRDQASREPPRVVQGVPDLSARGRQKLRQTGASDSTEEHEEVGFEGQQRRERTPQRLPDTAMEAWVPVALEVPASAETTHRAVKSIDSATEAKSTFLFDDSIDGSSGDGGEEAALEMEALRRQMMRRKQMFGGGEGKRRDN